MKVREYRKKVRQSLKDYAINGSGWNGEQNETRCGVEQDSDDYLHSGRIDLLDDAFRNIITRIKGGGIEILFGHEVWGEFKYDYLRIGTTESGYVPIEFIYYTEDSEIKKVDLYPRLDTNLDDPYEPVFRPISKHFERKGSKINYNYLIGLYLDSKETLVEKTDLTKDQVFFVEQRSPEYYPSYSKQ